MPPITDGAAVNFMNQVGRPLANSLLQSILTARAFKAEYDAIGLDGIFTNTADPVADGSPADGRWPVTGATVRALYTAAVDILTWAAVGTPTREARLRAIAVRAEIRS